MRSQSALRKGDKVLSIDGQRVGDGGELRRMIRASGEQGVPALQTGWCRANGAQLHVPVQLAQSEDKGSKIGRLARSSARRLRWWLCAMAPGKALPGVRKRPGKSALTVKMMAKMVIGQASLQNISGPLTIAEYAGNSASRPHQYMAFLA
ncbi:hypothetical protein [Comamonas sp. JC664]|uniref:hypothetical protein n=1 Tax=Comamonas sp. JC664 TaxID=2801917 RepID=UPI0036129953